MSAIGTSVPQTGDELDTIASLLASGHTTGGKHARVRLLEYGDYECASCSEAERQTTSTRLALRFVTGTALGIVLYQALFGFTSAFRVLLADGRSAGFRAQLVMFGTACLLFFTIGSVVGRRRPSEGFALSSHWSFPFSLHASSPRRHSGPSSSAGISCCPRRCCPSRRTALPWHG